jgi:hypothetical protein
VLDAAPLLGPTISAIFGLLHPSVRVPGKLIVEDVKAAADLVLNAIADNAA